MIIVSTFLTLRTKKPAATSAGFFVVSYQVAFNKLFVIPEGVIGNLAFKAGSPIQAFGDDTSFDCNLVSFHVQATFI
jgi:hypothetical protein